MDDYLFLLKYEKNSVESEASNLLMLVGDCLQLFELTYKVPGDDWSMRFLDICFHFHANHMYWSYEHMGKKPLLPFSSSNSKLVNRSIVKHCFDNVRKKSCSHLAVPALTAKRLASCKQDILTTFWYRMQKHYSGNDLPVVRIAKQLSVKAEESLPLCHTCRKYPTT